MTDTPQKVTAIAVVKPQEYDLDEARGTEISTSFRPMIAEREELAKEFKAVIALEIDADTVTRAGNLRRRFVKVRTGIAEIHKVQKQFFRQGGLFCDAIKNAQTLPVTQMEGALRDIEEHFANLEFERREKVYTERTAELCKYEVDAAAIPAGLGVMVVEVWDNYLAGVIASYKQRKEAERIAEAGRKAKEAAEAKEAERVRVENEELKKQVEKDRKERDANEAKAEADAKKRKKAEKALAARKAAELKKVKDAAAAELQAAEQKAEAKRIADAAKLIEERKAREKLERENKDREEADAKVVAAREKCQKEAEARLKDREHRATVQRAAIDIIMLIDVSLEFVICDKLIKAIHDGEIPNVTINY